MNVGRWMRLRWLMHVRRLPRDAALDFMDAEDLGLPVSVRAAHRQRFRCLTCGLEDSSAFVLAVHLRACRKPCVVRLRTAAELDALDRRLLEGDGPAARAVLDGAWRDLWRLN
jgi:hypothetical protein